jgi:hypothetical protein
LLITFFIERKHFKVDNPSYRLKDALKEQEKEGKHPLNNLINLNSSGLDDSLGP